jgi:TolB-like protein/Tfp pilus assembly protein PilF
MELVEGEPLSARLSRGALPADEALRLGRQLADAVAHAHERGVVHRDLKSANVVITPQGRAKVLDFGLARPLPGKDQAVTANTGLTAPGAVIGTLAYMAPEQLRGSPVDERCDIWALGIVLYEMAGGRRPFVGPTGFALSSAILTQAPPPLPARVPAALAEAIGRCLKKQPQARYQGAAELRAALEAIQAPPSADTAATTRAAVSRARTPSRKRIRSLAVLPLVSLSGDVEQEYFADGMTDALIAALAKLRALRVISRRSAMRYKARDRSLAEIAAELDVDAVVEGSVLRAGPRVRITVELVRPASSRCEWAESYDRDLKDVLFLQSEVAQAIAREIQLAVTPKEARRLASAHPVNPEAYEAWLKGRFQWYGLSREKLDAAMGYFRLAVEKDPSCALAWAGMAATWGSLTDAGFAPPHEAIPKAKAAALKALELDDTLAEVHVRLANLRFCIDWDWASARAAFRRAIELDPNSADARLFFADFLISLGRVKAAITEDERALKLDPFNFFLRGFVGWHLVYQRRHDEAIAELRKVVQMEPAFSSAHMGLWGAFYRKGIPAEAFAAARTFFEVLGDGETVQALEQGYAASGYSGAMSVAARRLTARAALTHVPAVRIARLHAHAGELDLALEWLERAYASRESPLVHLAVAWDWDSLRAHSRFQRLLRLMRLPPQ